MYHFNIASGKKLMISLLRAEGLSIFIVCTHHLETSLVHMLLLTITYARTHIFVNPQWSYITISQKGIQILTFVLIIGTGIEYY